MNVKPVRVVSIDANGYIGLDNGYTTYMESQTVNIGDVIYVSGFDVIPFDKEGGYRMEEVSFVRQRWGLRVNHVTPSGIEIEGLPKTLHKGVITLPSFLTSVDTYIYEPGVNKYRVDVEVSESESNVSKILASIPSSMRSTLPDDDREAALAWAVQMLNL